MWDLYNILKLLGCPETLLSVLVAFRENMKALVQFDGSMSKTFPICRKCQTRLRLGANIVWYILSALFAHALPEEDGIMLHTRSTGGLFNLSWLRAPRPSGFWFVNCCTPMTLPVFHSEMHLQNLCERFAKACYDFSMTINLKKTVVMSLVTSSPPRILVNGSLLNVVDKYSYLGPFVNSSNNLDDEINQWIGKASTNFGRLSFRVWKNHHLTIKLKIKVYTACILNALLYSSETWCAYRPVAILRGPRWAMAPPDFCLASCLPPPQFFSWFPVQVRLVDIYSRKLSPSNILNDNLEIL